LKGSAENPGISSPDDRSWSWGGGVPRLFLQLHVEKRTLPVKGSFQACVPLPTSHILIECLWPKELTKKIQAEIPLPGNSTAFWISRFFHLKFKQSRQPMHKSTKWPEQKSLLFGRRFQKKYQTWYFFRVFVNFFFQILESGYWNLTWGSQGANRVLMGHCVPFWGEWRAWSCRYLQGAYGAVLQTLCISKLVCLLSFSRKTRLLYQTCLSLRAWLCHDSARL